VREFNNKIYRLLTYGTLELFLEFKKAFLLLFLYSGWMIFSFDLRRVIIIGVVWLMLLAVLVYIDKNRIVYIPPKPRQKKEKSLQPDMAGRAEEVETPFVMKVDQAAFSKFTFNDYVADTFKKQEPNQILDLLADRNKLILEEVKRDSNSEV